MGVSDGRSACEFDKQTCRRQGVAVQLGVTEMTFSWSLLLYAVLFFSSRSCCCNVNMAVSLCGCDCIELALNESVYAHSHSH